MSLTKIETIELGSSQASITFSSIPQDYDDLIVKLSLRTDRPVNGDGLFIKLNGSGANFTGVNIFGNGSSVGSNIYTNTESALMAADGTVANTFSNTEIYLSNYTSSSPKFFSTDSVSENNLNESFQTMSASLFDSASVITSIVLESSTNSNFIAGTVASLYGVTSGGSGAVTTT